MRFLAHGLAEALQRVDCSPGLYRFMQLFDRLVRHEIGVDRFALNVLSARDDLRRRYDPHSGDYGLEGSQIFDLWPIVHDGIGIGFRSCRDKVYIQALPKRDQVGELVCSRLDTLACPGRDARYEAADHRSARCRGCRGEFAVHLCNYWLTCAVFGPPATSKMRCAGDTVGGASNARTPIAEKDRVMRLPPMDVPLHGGVARCQGSYPSPGGSTCRDAPGPQGRTRTRFGSNSRTW